MWVGVCVRVCVRLSTDFPLSDLHKILYRGTSSDSKNCPVAANPVQRPEVLLYVVAYGEHNLKMELGYGDS